MRNTQNRRIDSRRLREWLDEEGAIDGKTKLVTTGLNLAVIDRLLSGTYKSAIRPVTRKILCEATGLNERELFPPAPQEKKRAAR